MPQMRYGLTAKTGPLYPLRNCVCRTAVEASSELRGMVKASSTSSGFSFSCDTLKSSITPTTGTIAEVLGNCMGFDSPQISMRCRGNPISSSVSRRAHCVKLLSPSSRLPPGNDICMLWLRKCLDRRV